MSEEMQPIDPVTAAMLMGQVPDPCEPIVEVSHKVLTRLMDVVEFGDQLERVEKDRLLAHLKEVLAADQPQLWAMHSPGPGEVHPVISKEEAERQQSELLALCKKQFPEIPITVNVIPSPFSPLEHFEILAGELSEQVKHLQDYVKGLEGAAKALATDATLDKFRTSGLSIDGDNAYKRDLLDAVVGAMMLGRHNTTPPPAEHWAQRFWDIGREYAELPGAIVLPMPVMPEQPVDAIDDSWMVGYNAALRMREECQRAIDAAVLAAPVVNQQLTTAELTSVRCQCCQAEYAADRYDAGFIAGSGMCQACDAAIPAKDIHTPAARDVLAERHRQVTVEGYHRFRDNHYISYELSKAARAYIEVSWHALSNGPPCAKPTSWPWMHGFKWSDGRTMLVKAGALILAEIERLDRASKSSQQEPRP
jgi:hypothetical protein